MDSSEFLLQISRHFIARPCEDSHSAKQALAILYDFIREKAAEAAAQSAGSAHWRSSIFQIRQVLAFTPLRLFCDILAEDDLLPIRNAAKRYQGNTDGRFSGRKEAFLAQMALAPIVLAGAQPELLAGTFRDCRFRQAMRHWIASSQGAPFFPPRTTKPAAKRRRLQSPYGPN